jgi:SHS2 domain-containing protein
VTYRYLPHTADIRVAIDSPTLGDLLREALVVSRHLFVGDSKVAAREYHRLTLDAKDAEELVLAFLQELLYRYTTDGFVPATLTVDRVTPTALRSHLAGERLDPARHVAEPEVKAVTRHGLVVRHTDDGWRAEVLFDV